MKLIQVNLTPFGAYFLYKINVTRGIRGKSKGKVDEIIVVGIHKNKMQQYCIDHNLIITNKAVYMNNDMSKPILFADGKGNYVSQSH